jgi:photosystem II stability/assembly factor-like uncharacterized protein
VRLVRQVVRSEEPEVGIIFAAASISSSAARIPSVASVAVAFVGRAFQLVASSAEGSEWAQDGAELGPDGFLDCLVAA